MTAGRACVRGGVGGRLGEMLPGPSSVWLMRGTMALLWPAGLTPLGSGSPRRERRLHVSKSKHHLVQRLCSQPRCPPPPFHPASNRKRWDTISLFCNNIKAKQRHLYIHCWEKHVKLHVKLLRNFIKYRWFQSVMLEKKIVIKLQLLLSMILQIHNFSGWTLCSIIVIEVVPHDFLVHSLAWTLSFSGFWSLNSGQVWKFSTLATLATFWK